MKKVLSLILMAIATLAFGNTDVIAAEPANPLTEPAYLAAKAKVIKTFSANATGYSSQLDPPCKTVPHYTDNSTTDRAQDDPADWIAYDSDGQEVTELQFATPEAIAKAPDGLIYILWAIEESKVKKGATPG